MIGTPRQWERAGLRGRIVICYYFARANVNSLRGNMSVQLQRWTFTVDDYHRLADVGILTEDDRVELIDGEIIKKSPIGSRHVGCVNRLNAILSQRAGSLCNC